MTDVLIIGAGSAGSVLAEQLSADPDCQVTVIEAGPGLDDPTIRSVLSDATVLPIAAGSPVVRRYRTALTRDPAADTDIVRGVCLGGSGAVNGGYFCRALPVDFDDPAMPGWSWSEVEERYRAIETDLDFPDFGGTGPIPVSRIREFSSSTAVFIAAAQQGGYRWLPDLNAPETGVGAVPLNIGDSRRIGPGAAFLAPALTRGNLTVLTDTTATRIRTAGGRATGVDAVGPRGPVVLDADRVVLSAGAIATAHLLMLSGIGPAGELAAYRIDVVSDLPVGQRCWDHPEWVMSTEWTASPGRPVLEAVLVTEDLEIRPYTTGFGMRAEPDIGVALMAPSAHGRVSLASADPSVPPRIEHRYDSEPSDLAALRRGCDLVSDLIGGTMELGEPGWSTSQHLCGTAPMGTDGDQYAVVDPQCRVLGVPGLWVIDGSVLPRIPHRGPHATIAMIGHRGAEFVR
jgi:predicted dehydrogenase (TIGR03970 family)